MLADETNNVRWALDTGNTGESTDMNIAEETVRTLIVIGLALSLLLLWIVAYVDLARRRDLTIPRKAMWAAIMFFGAYIGIAAYFMLRPVPEVAGKGAEATTPVTSRLVAELESLHQLHAEGAVADDDYLAQKSVLIRGQQQG